MGRLICLVGIDGAGKTTVAKALAEQLGQKGVNVAYVWGRREAFVLKPAISLAKRLLREPPRSEAAGVYPLLKERRQRGIFSRPFVRRLWAYAVTADYALRVSLRIRPLLRHKEIVISDRYIPDLVADLAANFGWGPQEVQRALGLPLWHLFPRPYRYIYLSVPPEVGFTRKADGTSLEYLEDRKMVYDLLAHRMGMAIIDATQPLEHVVKVVREAIE